MSIRAKLRERAGQQLEDMEKMLLDAANDCTTHHTVSGLELCQLVAKPGNASLRRKLITRMSNSAESQLLEALEERE